MGLIQDHTRHIERLRRQIAVLERLRGTPDEPPVIEAQLGRLRHALKWHVQRHNPAPPNTGYASLYERGGRSQRKAGLRRQQCSDIPAISLPPGPA